MSLENLLQKITTKMDQVTFDEVLLTIADTYHYSPSRLTNGLADDQVVSLPGSNEGSCKIFAFAKLNDLTAEQTLHCFGNYYRHDVLEHPQADDHDNIRSFMRHGWNGIQFEPMPLTAKKP